ncbi:M23 family metallopeptidase [Brevibacillus sp. SYSU BS000544]|uniref:M23 family metallopeptidase n=1 Tax=Brevibacillus sp. SYSU BS000544 TaxID=3416443 RepID=UPI003CE4639A
MKGSFVRYLIAGCFVALVILYITQQKTIPQTNPTSTTSDVTQLQSNTSISKAPPATETSKPPVPAPPTPETTTAVKQSEKLPEKQIQSIAILPQELFPGDVIYLESTEHPTVYLWDKKFNLQPMEKKFVRFIPIPLETKPGLYPILSGTKKSIATVQIKAKQFAVDEITVSEQMESMQRNTKRINADQQKINKARSTSSPKPYFNNTFIVPVEGEETTPYGYRRVVNKKPANPHLAIDIANKEGTPVLASQDGKVVLADTMYLNGNMIILDHGLRVYSTYSHLSVVNVKPGEMVKRGQVIGKVGTTGFSTGPHLHYAMLIGNTFVNPNSFFMNHFMK